MMANRNLRWLALTLFALANLIFWAGAATAVGLAVSQSLNLGLEAFIREGQATAAAVWEQIGRGASNPAVEPGQQATPVPAQTDSTRDEPLAAVVPPGDLAAPTTPQPNATAVADSGAEAGAMPTPEPEPTLLSHALLLADPSISNLALLDAEMARSTPGRALQIRYQEDALNAEIATLWQNNPDLPYRNVRVDLKRDQVVVTGKISILGFGVKAEVSGTILAMDCVPVLKIERLAVAGVMTPRFVKDQVEDMILEAMAWYPPDYPLCLEQIVLEETRATVYGYCR